MKFIGMDWEEIVIRIDERKWNFLRTKLMKEKGWKVGKILFSQKKMHRKMHISLWYHVRKHDNMHERKKRKFKNDYIKLKERSYLWEAVEKYYIKTFILVDQLITN